MAATRVGSNGQVSNQAYGHARGTRAVLHMPQSLIGKPLQKHMEVDIGFMLRRICLHTLTHGIMQLSRPVLPSTCRTQRSLMMSMQGFVTRMAFQRLATLSP